MAALQIRRGRKYDAIILDPPTFGRGAGGEMYKIERDLKDTLGLVKDLLSESPSFVLFSSHTPGLSQIVAENILGQLFPQATLESGEMLLEPAAQSGNQTISNQTIKQFFPLSERDLLSGGLCLNFLVTFVGLVRIRCKTNHKHLNERNLTMVRQASLAELVN